MMAEYICIGDGTVFEMYVSVASCHPLIILKFCFFPRGSFYCLLLRSCVCVRSCVYVCEMWPSRYPFFVFVCVRARWKQGISTHYQKKYHCFVLCYCFFFFFEIKKITFRGNLFGVWVVLLIFFTLKDNQIHACICFFWNTQIQRHVPYFAHQYQRANLGNY